MSNDNNALFSIQPAIAPDGTLTFTPAPNANGATTVSVYLQDNGGTANGGIDSTATITFTITVNAINDAPSFTPGGNITVNEDSAAYSAAWATAITPGPANESAQTLTFHVSNDNNALFSIQPAIAPDGTLTFTPAPNANGTTTVSVYLQDNGGTANGGIDSTATITFTITVNAINDAPSFTPGGNITVNEDSAAYSAAWATAITPGPANESAQTLTFHVTNDNNALFSIQPAIAPDGTLTFTPAPNANGTTTVSVYLQDNGGTANGGIDSTATITFTITVNAVNDAPVIALPPPQVTSANCPLVLAAATASPISISDIDAGIASMQLVLSATNGTLTLSQITGLVFTVGDGADDPSMVFTGSQADINAALDGLRFNPTPFYSGPAAIQITCDDQGNAGLGGPLSDAQMLSITVNGSSFPPSLIVAIDPLIYHEGDDAIPIDPTISLADPDSLALARATIRITNYHPDQDVFTFTAPAGILADWDPTSATLTLSGSATLAQYQSALRSILYSNTSDRPGPATRFVVFQISDGVEDSPIATRPSS